MNGRHTSLTQNVCLVAPLLAPAIGLIVGVVADNGIAPSPTIWLFTFSASLSMLVWSRARRGIGLPLLCVGAICAGGFLHAQRNRIAPSDSVEQYVGNERKLARLRGTVVSPPRLIEPTDYFFAPWSYQSERMTFLLDVDSAESETRDVRASGLIRLTVREPVLNLELGERVEVFGWLYAIPPPVNPGGYDWAAHYRRKGIVAGMTCNHVENVRRITAPSPRTSLIHDLRTLARQYLVADWPTDSMGESTLLSAMILGQRSQLNRSINDAFIQAGCAHFLAVSGIHVAIVASLARLVCMILGFSRRNSAWLMIVAVIGYAILTEPRPSVLRASVLAIAYCVSMIVRQPRSHLNWLAGSAIFLALLNPAMVFDIGYQLSYAAVIGIIFLAPILKQMPRAIARRLGRQRESSVVVIAPRSGKLMVGRMGMTAVITRHMRGRILRSVSVGIIVAIAAWLSTFPLVAFHFDRVQIWGAVSTVVVMPLVTALMAVGFAKLAVGAIAPTVGAWLAAVLDILNAYLIQIVTWFSHFPFAEIHLAPPPAWLICSYYATLLCGICRVRLAGFYETTLKAGNLPELELREEEAGVELPDLSPSSSQANTSVRKICSYSCLALFIVTSIGAIDEYLIDRRSNELAITFLSVGAGSATVVEFPSGETMLYDAGSSRPFDVGRHVIAPYLRSRGIRRIDQVILSHPNLDHFSGLPSVLDEFDCGSIRINRFFETFSTPRSPSRAILELLNERGQPVEIDEVPKSWRFGDVVIEAVSPTFESIADAEANDTSTVLRLSYAGWSVLLTGDIEDFGQRMMIEDGVKKADILALPHHGGVGEMLDEFLNAVGAEILIRSSNHRMAETHNGLRELVGSTRIYNTADVGAIQIVIRSTGQILVSSGRRLDPF